jgi:hypothetical protein
MACTVQWTLRGGRRGRLFYPNETFFAIANILGFMMVPSNSCGSSRRSCDYDLCGYIWWPDF